LESLGGFYGLDSTCAKKKKKKKRGGGPMTRKKEDAGENSAIRGDPKEKRRSFGEGKYSRGWFGVFF